MRIRFTTQSNIVAVTVAALSSGRGRRTPDEVVWNALRVCLDGAGAYEGLVARPQTGPKGWRIRRRA